jgi:hypothetical protein
MGTRSGVTDGSQVTRKRGLVVTVAAAGLAVAAMGLTYWDEVQLDSALSLRIKRAVKGTPKTEDQLKVEQEVSRTLTTTLVDEIRKLGIPAEPARMAASVAGPTLSIEGQIVSINEATRRSDW